MNKEVVGIIKNYAIGMDSFKGEMAGIYFTLENSDNNNKILLSINKEDFYILIGIDKWSDMRKFIGMKVQFIENHGKALELKIIK